MSLLDAERARRKRLEQRQNLGASEVVRHLRENWGDDLAPAPGGASSSTGFRAKENAKSVATKRAEEIQGLFKTTEKKTNVLEVVRGVVSNDANEKSIFVADAKDLLIEARWRRKQAAFRPAKRPGDDTEQSGGTVFGTLLGDGRWESCAACLHAWNNWARRLRFERNRDSMRAALAWDDPDRAAAVMRARETLAKSDRVTWLSVQFCRKVEDKVQTVYPVTSPPALRRESGEVFSALAQELRSQLAEQVQKHMEEAAEAERNVVQRLIIKEKTKDVKKAQARDEAATWQLECAKRKLHHSTAFAALFQQLYLTSLAFSVERSATTLTQMFADTSYLKIRIMAMPFLKPDGGTEAVLVTSPNHGDIQAHLNALLEAVVVAACSTPAVWLPSPADSETSARDKDANAALQRFLARSASYRVAVKGLDTQLRHSFRAVDRRLQAICEQLDKELLTQSALLSGLYVNRGGLFQREGRIPPECSSNCSFLGSAFLADFVMLWLCKPLAEGEHRPEPFKALLMNLFYSLAKVIASSKVSLPVGPVPPEIAGHLARDENARVMDSAVSALIADSVEGKGAGAAGFHTALASVVDGSGQLAEVLLQLLLQPELFLRPADELSSCDSENLCEWLQDLQRSCEDWERVVRSVRALSQCGPFALDLRYFTFIGEQVGPALLGLATYAVNLAGVNSGRRLWKDMSDLVARFSKPVASLEDMVGELELLSNVYQNLNNFQNDCSQLTPLVAALASVTKSFLLTSRLPDLRSTGRTASVESMPERFLLDFQEDEDERKAEGALAGSAERREKGRAHGVGHPYGGLSTGALQFLCLKTEDVRQKLQGLVEKVLATLPARSEPFQKLVAEESRAVDEAALTAWKELEEKLSPSNALAIDARCSLTRVGAADTETRTGPGEAKAATLQLTTGGFSSFFDVQSALADFERSYRELDGRNQLMNRFQDLAGSTSRPGEGRMEKLRAKLVALRVFWRAAQEWDKEVEKRLRQSPALVNITDLQRQAHFTLRAVSQCPKEHQELLRQRINAFRQVFRQLFMVQSIMCLNAKNETRKLVPYSPPQAHVWSNLFDTPVNLKPRDFSGNCFGFEKELLPGEASTGDKPGFDPNDTMTSLGRLLRAGVLDDHAKVARQYAMATRESQEMRSLLCHVISWSQQSLPVTPAGAKGQPVLAAAALAEQLESLERQLESALRRAKPYPQLFQEEKPLAGDDFYLGTFYKDLSETWLRRLRAMRQNLLKFMECQDLWLHLSPSKNDLRAELRKADVIFRSLADDMAANPQARTCLEDVLSSEGGVQEACDLFTQAYARASRDLQDLRAECFRLFFLEDEALLELCGSTNISRSNCLPQLFPGWSEVTFAPDAATPGSSALSITGVRPTSGPPLQLLEPVALNVPLQEWLKRLEQQVATTFQQLLRQEASGKHERDELQTNLPEHVAVTAQRIRWTYLVEAMSSRPEAMDIFTAYAEKRVKEEVARNTGAASSKETFAGAGLTWALELRALLQRSKEASDLVFLRMAWRGEALAVQLGPLCLEFGWELYGGEELICPVTEKCYVDLAQQLCDVSLPQLQGMGCSVTRAFAASCGIACHQCYVLSEPESLRGFRRLALGAGLLGHWVILQGMDDLEPSCSEACMNYLAKYMQQLSLSLEAFRDKREPEISASALEQLFAKLPPGSLVRGLRLQLDTAKLGFRMGASSSEVLLPASRSDMAKRPQSWPLTGDDWEVPRSCDTCIPRVLHPAAALFVAPGEKGRRWELLGVQLRPLAFPAPDLTLYIHAGLVRIGILNLDAARMLNRAVSAFNLEAQKVRKKGRQQRLGLAEVRAICAFAASSLRAYKNHELLERDNTLDEQILCEAWLCAVATQLDASAEREMLWRCTVMSFGASKHFEAHQTAFRQNLFNDTLMAQRVAKKDVSALFYIQIADTLRQKYSYDFYNPMVVQKCIATTQALLNDRDVAVVGEAGAGKSDCITTLLEAAENFLDFGRSFPKVKLLRINTLAQDASTALMVVSNASAPLRETDVSKSNTSTREESIWLTLDGPLNPELYEAVSAAMPLTIAGTKKPYLSKTRGFRIIVETDLLAELSPATAASLAVTFIDTERGPTWKDRAMAWAHRFVLTCPEYAHFMQLTKELLMHLMDSILAFVLYYFHYNPESSGAATEGEALDYRHQTTCFLSCLTSLLVDPVVEKQLYSATKEGQAALEREVRLLIGMSSIAAFGASLFTSQRPRFERYIRENVLDPIHANSFPPLYDLYLDSKTGQFQAVGKIVHLTEPIVECHHVCVATEEFVAFQLRLRRLLAIGAPVLLAGTGGSGKSALLRYLHGCKSSSMAGLLHSCPELSPWEIQKALTLNLAPRAGCGPQGAGILAPGNEKRLVVFIDDLHLSDVGAGPGPGQTRLGEWIRFALEAQGFYRMEDGHFVAIRDTSFLPSLLAPDSQNLEICKRFSRHFFLAFMESPSEASIQKIFSTILTLNLTAGIPEEVMQNLTRSFWSMRLHPNVEVDTPGQKLAAQLLQATLGVWNETDLASKQRLHGLARVFWDVAHAFSRTPVEDLASPVDVGYLWTFAMRTSVLDAMMPRSASHRRRVYAAVARSCAAHFGVLLGGKTGLEHPELQALEMDSLAFIDTDAANLRSLRRVSLVQARDHVLERIGSPYVGLRQATDTPSKHSEESEGLDDEDSENEPEAEGEGEGEFSIDRKFKSSAKREEREQAAPDPVSLAMCQDLLTVDNEASLMWLMEEQTLCTLLRLSHILTTYPITCLVGGWSHLPLLSLAGKLLAGSSGGELNLLHGVSVEALEQQLLQKMQPLPSKRKLHKQKAQKKSDGSGLRLVAVNELDFPAQAPEAFLAREQRRFFRLGAGGMEEPTKTFLEDEEDEQKRLVVICRSPSSLEDLVARCGFLRQTLVATFHILPPAALQQVALVYLGNKLTSKIDLSALPKLHKKLLNKSMARAGRSSVKKGRGTTTDDGKIWQQAMFIPLARIVEMVHLRIRDVVSAEVGQDYALDFCCAVRFSGFVQAIARLAMHFRTLQVHRGTMHESVLSRLKALDKFVLEVEAKYRSNRVSLRLLAEEARRLLDRTARETELRSAARACLQEVKGRKKVVESHIAAVDAKYGAELERALNAACSSLRQLKQLDRCHFQNLAQYRHMPAALVRVLGAAKAMLLHIEEPSDGAPVFQPRAVPKHALPAATAAAAGPIGIPQESKPPSRAEMFDWAKTLAAAETLDTLSAAAAGQALPGWLAEVLEKFLACPDCEASQLWAMSPAAARISQWLRARLACHRVLMRMEDERQSMGDLSSQLVEVNASLATAKAELRRAERALEDLEAAHLATVQQRQTLGRSETSLQLQLERAQQVLEIAAPRRRECQVLVPEILESEESPAQWGAILTIAVLSCYGAAFGPALRLPVMKELQQVLQDCGVPTPPNLFTSAYLQHFLPRSFLEAYRWPDCNLFQSALATEVSGSLCTLMLDPFGIATDWLKDLHTQRHPGENRSDSDLQRLMDDGEPTEWEALPKANDKELQPLVCNASDSPETLTCKLQYCMRQGSAMIIQLEEVQHLQGFVGTLLVLLSGNSQVRLTTNRHTVLFNLSQRFTRASPASGGGPNGVEAETEELKIHIFSLLQRLEAALPLAHRRFHLYVISPSCPSRCLWGPSKVKTQQLFQVPSAIWSSCCIVSMDVEPSHAAQAFLPILQAKDERHQRQLVLRAQETRLLVIEELLLHLLGKMENSDLQSDKVVVPLQQLSACAARLAISTGVPSGSRKFLPLARSVALLQSVLVDTELLFEAFKGEVALTENHSMRPSVKDFLQQLLKLQSPEEAVMQLLEKLMQALPPQRALLFRQLLVGRETGVPLDWQGTAQLLVKGMEAPSDAKEVREDSEKEAKQRSQP